MVRFFSLLLLPVLQLLIAAGPASAVEAGAQPGPALLRAFLAETVTLEADFSQVLIEGDSERTRVSEGRFYLHRPQRFRWDYASPAPQLVVADGEHLWLYDPDLEQVTVRRLDEGLSSTPAMLLSGEGSLDDSFEVGAAYREDGIDWVELVPRGEATDFSGLRVGFRDDALASMELIDALGQVTVINFSELVVNEPLDPALFVFVPPAGADVLRDQGY